MVPMTVDDFMSHAASVSFAISAPFGLRWRQRGVIALSSVLAIASFDASTEEKSL
jgi:hypothetical protein